MKYEKELNNIEKDIKKRFNDIETLMRYMPNTPNQKYDRRDPNFDDEQAIRDFNYSVEVAKENLLEDKKGFEEFVLEYDSTRNLIIDLAKKICMEVQNG